MTENTDTTKQAIEQRHTARRLEITTAGEKAETQQTPRPETTTASERAETHRKKTGSKNSEQERERERERE